MPSTILRAGTMEELLQPIGDWLFVDVGFAHTDKTCGCLLASAPSSPGELPPSTDPSAETMTFGSLRETIASLAHRSGPPLHLVLEAPLSAAFDQHGNPTGRDGERRGAKTRYWYVGLGCSVLVASLYILQGLLEPAPTREVRLFEGLVSFKDRATATDHLADVEALRRVVWSGGRTGGRFRTPAPVDGDVASTIQSTLSLLGLDPTPPPIIEAAAF